MLQPLVRTRGLELWFDELIEGGQEWRPELEDAIARANVALLLVSPDFLASDFIMDEELPALRERGIPVVPALLRASHYGVIDELMRVQWAHDPKRDGPVANAADVDAAIVRVTDAVMRHVASDAIAVEDDHAGEARGEPAVPALSRDAAEGGLHGVPEAPAGFVERDELDELRDVLLSAGRGKVGITGARALGLHGQGGIGKTVLAAALARDVTVRRHFPDGVFWVTVGETPDLVEAQIGVLERLGQAGDEVRTSLDGVTALRAALTRRRCLLVVDDVWTAAAAQAFDVTDHMGRVLYTTRDAGTLRDVRAEVRRIEVLSEGAARKLLATLGGSPDEQSPDDLDRILAATGRVALALALVGAAVGRGGRSWREAADELEHAQATFLDHPYANVFKAMGVAVGTLSRDVATAHESLAVYGDDVRVPLAAVERFWAHLYDLRPDQTYDYLAQIAKRKLLTMDRDAISLHDLQRDFLLLRVENLGLLHHELLAAYRRLLPAADAPWRQLPRREPYIWEHLVEHLAGAGDAQGARRLAHDLGYLAIRVFDSGPHGAEADVRAAARLDREGSAGVRWSQRLLSQWGHHLAGHERLDDLASTLATRTATATEGIDVAALRAVTSAPLLIGRWGMPDASPQLTRVLNGHTGEVTGVAFSPDGRVLASASIDRTVRVWDAASGAEIHVLRGHLSRVREVAFGAESRTLASAGDDGTVRLWDPTSGAETAVLNGHDGPVWGVAFSADGQMLASSGADFTVRLWDPATGEQTAVLSSHNGRVFGVAFSRDGRMLASASADRTVRLWDTASGAQTALLVGHSDWAWGVAFSGDGQTVASVSNDRTVRLWDTASGTERAVLEGHGREVLGVAFAADGRTLATAGADGVVRLWDPDTCSQLAVLEGHRRAVLGIEFNAREHLLASAGNDGTVRLWDPAVPSGAQATEGHSGRVSRLVFSSDGRRLASAGDDGTLRLWDPASGAQRAVMVGHADGVSGVAFSADGRVLASAGDDGTVRLWDPAGGVQTAVMRGHGDRVRDVAFSPVGRILASAGDDGTVRLWDPASGAETALLDGHHDGALGLAFSADGRILASAGADRMVRLWNAETGRQTAVLEGHTGRVLAVAFSPDGRRLASAGADETVRLWDPSTGASTGILDEHRDAVRGLAFSADGRFLASAGDDRTVRLWHAADGALAVSVRLGGLGVTLAIALHGNGMAVGIDRFVAYLLIT